MMLQVSCRRNAEMLSGQWRSKCKCVLLLFVCTSFLSLQWCQLDRNILSRAHENYPFFRCRQWTPPILSFAGGPSVFNSISSKLSMDLWGSDQIWCPTENRDIGEQTILHDVNVGGAQVNFARCLDSFFRPCYTSTSHLGQSVHARGELVWDFLLFLASSHL